MSTPRPRKLDKPERRVRHATDDELTLWQGVAGQATPLSMNRAPSTKPLPRLAPPRGYDPLATRAAPSVPARRFYPDARTVDALSDNTPGLDRNTAKALRKGERAPEARVDLHGMTLDRAHAALTRFILTEQQRGTRCVLVITGKGGDYRGRASGFGDSRGALKRDVPRWLSEPTLAGAVVGIFQAHRRHGGEGALYVYLKRPR